jgi:predicted DNA-binding transcriptional regulator AlpA
MEPQLSSREKFLRLPDVLSYFPVSKSHWWEGVKSGLYPKGIKISPKITVWRESDINALISKTIHNGETK